VTVIFKSAIFLGFVLLSPPL